MKNFVFFTMGSFVRFFKSDSIRKITAALDTALNGRSLDVDTAVVGLTTGPEYFNFWSSDPYPFFTRDFKRFVTPGETELGDWNRNDPLYLDRAEGYNITHSLALYPSFVTRVGKLDYDVSCTSALGKLTQFGHKGGIYDASTQTTAGNLLREIAGYVNGYNGSVTLYIAPEFENIILYGWLPYLSPTGENGAATGSARDNFLQVLFAINACVREDDHGVLRIENLPVEPHTQSIIEDRIYRNNARVVTEQPVTSVTLLEHKFVIGSGTDTLFEGTATAGQTIVFQKPMANLSATGFSITEQGANYAVLSAGTGTLTGTSYLDTTREIIRTVSEALVNNTEHISEATLISVTNSADVADRLAAYYACRQWIECDAQVEWEKPGDVINIWDPFDEVIRSACIEKISPLSVSKVMRGRVSALVGFTPWQTVIFDDVVEVIKSNTTWRATDHPGVNRLTVYVVSGAQGGARGEDGQPATQPTIQTGSHTAGNNTTNEKGINFDQAHSAAGKGGLAGKPGNGGRVNRFEISLSGNETFAVTIGSGGAGATAANVEGADGEDSFFGNYSSAGGSFSDYGITDPKTGITYGLPGAAGTNGNDGSSADNTPAPISGKTNGNQGAKWSHTYFDEDYEPRKYTAIGWGTYGGGAAVGHNGGDGNSGISVSSVSRSAITASLTSPGKGANASAPAKAVNAQGGTGGNGGGGNGAYVTAGVTCSYNNKTSSAGDLNLSFANQSAAGAGSRGGDGGNGIVMLIYREPRT